MEEHAEPSLYDVIAELDNGSRIRLCDSITLDDARTRSAGHARDLQNAHVISDDVGSAVIATAHISQIYIQARRDAYSTDLGTARAAQLDKEIPGEIDSRCTACEHDKFWNSGALRNDPREYTCLNCGHVIRTTDPDFEDNLL